jgi:hypothetical protein
MSPALMIKKLKKMEQRLLSKYVAEDQNYEY